MRKDITQLFKEFMFECEFARKLKPSTLNGYRETFKLLMKLKPDITLENISTATFIEFFRLLEERERRVGDGSIIKKGIKKSTISTYWSKLNSFCEWMRVAGHLAVNPFASMRYPAPVYEDRKFIKKNDVEKIFTAIHNYPGINLFLLKRNLVIFEILLFCGLRRSELVALQIRDIDIERRTLTVRAETSKIPRTRYIPIHSTLLRSLKDYIEERRRGGITSQFLIVSGNRDEKLTVFGLAHLVKRIIQLSGVKFTPHQFRHTFGVNQVNQGSDISRLQQLLGHTDIRMTSKYLRDVPTESMRGNIEKMSIDNLL